MELLIYKHDGESHVDLKRNSGVEVVQWRPTIRNWKPPDKGLKYVGYSIFHWLKIFRNNKYSSIAVEQNGEIKASLLVVPSYFQWPFMSGDDVQFTYVITHHTARRQGWAGYLVAQAVRMYSSKDRRIWYVTDSDNIASQNLAEKSGFKLLGTAKPRRSMFHRVHVRPVTEVNRVQ